jgi:hypothetical protein
MATNKKLMPSFVPHPLLPTPTPRRSIRMKARINYILLSKLMLLLKFYVEFREKLAHHPLLASYHPPPALSRVWAHDHEQRAPLVRDDHRPSLYAVLSNAPCIARSACRSRVRSSNVRFSACIAAVRPRYALNGSSETTQLARPISRSSPDGSRRIAFD